MPWNLSARLPHALEPMLEVAPCLGTYLRGCPMPWNLSARLPHAWEPMLEVAPCLGTYLRGCPMPWNLSARLPHALEPLCEVAPCLGTYVRGCPMPWNLSAKLGVCPADAFSSHVIHISSGSSGVPFKKTPEKYHNFAKLDPTPHTLFFAFFHRNSAFFPRFF